MRRRTLELVLALLAGCVETLDAAPPLDPSEFGCTSCHGAMGQSAPPRDVSGRTDGARLGVGAHAAHARVACDECHLVPANLHDPGHVDTKLPAEVTFTRLSSATWDRASATCANTVCHGDFSPRWDRLDGSQAACGSCHGVPPPPPHPASEACESCHAPVAGPNKTIADATRHADGTLDLGSTDRSCAAACHGAADDPMPPPSLTGETMTTAIGVGAHAAHASGGQSGRPVACSACHLVPVESDDPGHVDTSTPAEVQLGSGRWDRASASCAGSRCHGVAAPVWTRVDGTQAACGSCHGFPPASPHPQSSSCQGCHSNAGPGMTVDRATHVDGIVNF